MGPAPTAATSDAAMATMSEVEMKPSESRDTPPSDPGRVTLHRLNRVEYENTVTDLLGTSQRVAGRFPADDSGYGFDNNADVLSLSPLLMELYFDTGEALLAESLTPWRVTTRRFEAELMDGTTGAVTSDRSAWFFPSIGSIFQRARIAVEGEIKAHLAVGDHRRSATFVNDYYGGEKDRNLIVDWLELEGPLGVATDNPHRKSLLICEPIEAEPQKCWRLIAENFGTRAYRRPVTPSELERLVALATAARSAGESLEAATRAMLLSVLVSPHFLFRVELDADPKSPEAHPLNDYELASRLSYFLWSSMPDETLFALARDNELSNSDTLREQVERMLRSPRANALIRNFAGQWLQLRSLDFHTPNAELFPGFDDALRSAIRQETDRYLHDFFFGGQPMSRLLTSGYSYLNERLANHYGIEGVHGAELQKIVLTDTTRVGLLTQSSILTLTSYGARTSPVKRGNWVLSQLMCEGPPPPPPNVPSLKTDAQARGTVRERMEAHRSNPECASCHTVMDPIGFGLENFDAVDKYRTADNGEPIDAAGSLPGGQAFETATELSRLLEGDPSLYRCISMQLLTYALGRGIESYDRDDLDNVTARFVESGYQMNELIQQIVASEAFRMRRGDPVTSMPDM
jgi:hypothetical protein